MKQNQIICGDSIQILKEFPRRCIDITITSPPYNLDKKYDKYDDNLLYNDYLSFTKEWLFEVLRVTKTTGRLIVDVALQLKGDYNLFNDILNAAREVGWKYKTTIVWSYMQLSRKTGWGSWKSPSAPTISIPIEMIPIFYNEKWNKKTNKISDITGNEFLRWTNGLWMIPYKNSKVHPASFPEEIPKRLLKLFSYRKDVVLDPFNGIGTTCIEARRLQRYFIGIDISKNYCKVAVENLKFIERQGNLDGESLPFVEFVNENK